MTATSIDLCFPIKNSLSVPVDHGYPLYGAVVAHLGPEAHGAGWLGIHPLAGSIEGTELSLRERADVRLRLPVDKIPLALSLSDKTLELAGRSVALGRPEVHALTPSTSLDARLVYVKLTEPPMASPEGSAKPKLDETAVRERYLAELARQLLRLDIEASPELRGRRRFTVKGNNLLGYSVRVAGLDGAQSIALQTQGLGGKRAMGCGLFRPTRR